MYVACICIWTSVLQVNWRHQFQGLSLWAFSVRVTFICIWKLKYLSEGHSQLCHKCFLTSALCLICLCHTELMNPKTTFIKEPHLFWHLMSKKQLLETHHLSCCRHKLLPEYLVLSMSDKIIQQLIFLGLSTEMYHTTSFKGNQNSTKRDPPHFVLHSQA